MFDKIKTEILDTYIKVNNIKFKKGKFDLTELSHDVNSIFYKFISSPYFENNFEPKLIKINGEDIDYYMIIAIDDKYNSDNYIEYDIKDDNDRKNIIEYFSNKDQNLFSKISLKTGLESGTLRLRYDDAKNIIGKDDLRIYSRNIDVLSNFYNPYDDDGFPGFPYSAPYNGKKEVIEINYNDKINKTIEKLKENKIFDVIFSDDEVVKLLSVKNRKEFDFKLLKIENSKEEVAEYLKFEESYNLNSALKNIYGMKYFSQSRDKNYNLIIAHNEFEIAGTLAMIDGKTYHDIPKNLCSYVSYIEAGTPFFGNKLGLRLMEKAIKHAKENDLMIIRTSSSENGKQYIKDKITEMGIKENIPLISESERDIIIPIMINLKNNKKDEIKKAVIEALTYIREHIKEEDLRYSSKNINIIKMITDKYKPISNKHKL